MGSYNGFPLSGGHRVWRGRNIEGGRPTVALVESAAEGGVAQAVLVERGMVWCHPSEAPEGAGAPVDVVVRPGNRPGSARPVGAPMTIRLPIDLRAQMAEFCDRHQLSTSAMVSAAVEAYMDAWRDR